MHLAQNSVYTELHISLGSWSLFILFFLSLLLNAIYKFYLKRTLERKRVYTLYVNTDRQTRQPLEQKKNEMKRKVYIAFSYRMYYKYTSIHCKNRMRIRLFHIFELSIHFEFNQMEKLNCKMFTTFVKNDGKCLISINQYRFWCFSISFHFSRSKISKLTKNFW